MSRGLRSAFTAGHRRDSVVLGAAVGVVGVTFGVLAESAGFGMAKASVMSLLIFTGASQFGAVSVIDSGGSPLSAVGSALLLAARNGLYGMRLSALLDRLGPKRVAGAHLVIDETTAMALAQQDEELSFEAFWMTGLSLFTFWNLGTLVGVQLGAILGEPEALGLDAVFPASFIALIGPLLRERPARAAALIGAAIAVSAVPLTPAGTPILLAAFAVVPAMFIRPVPDRGAGDSVSMGDTATNPNRA